MNNQVKTPLPRWKCHKEVWAAKILRVEESDGVPSSGRLVLTFDDTHEHAFAEVDEAWLYKHNPQPGGYYVQYADGYRSYSPAQTFEEGYTRLA